MLGCGGTHPRSRVAKPSGFVQMRMETPQLQLQFLELVIPNVRMFYTEMLNAGPHFEYELKCTERLDLLSTAQGAQVWVHLPLQPMLVQPHLTTTSACLRVPLQVPTHLPLSLHFLFCFPSSLPNAPPTLNPLGALPPTLHPPLHR